MFIYGKTGMLAGVIKRRSCYLQLCAATKDMLRKVSRLTYNKEIINCQ